MLILTVRLELMAENGPREEIAKVVSSDLLSIFKWEQYGPYDQDFPCRKQDKHLDKEKNKNIHILLMWFLAIKTLIAIRTFFLILI